MALSALVAGLSELAAQPAPGASPRIALVIGEAAYKTGPLSSSANDAGLIADTLHLAGFDVTGAADLDQDGLRRSLREFVDKAAAAGPDAVVFIYLSGRAVQYAGENYLAPIEATIPRASNVPLEAVRLSDYLQPLAQMPLKARIVVLDTSRINAFAQSGEPLAGGLALVEPDTGSLYAFNAAPDSVAPNETGPYGVYAQALTEMLREGGLPVDAAFPLRCCSPARRARRRRRWRSRPRPTCARGPFATIRSIRPMPRRWSRTRSRPMSISSTPIPIPPMPRGCAPCSPCAAKR
jgi:uncharacterized caspase-like protein